MNTLPQDVVYIVTALLDVSSFLNFQETGLKCFKTKHVTFIDQYKLKKKDYLDLKEIAMLEKELADIDEYSKKKEEDVKKCGGVMEYAAMIRNPEYHLSRQEQHYLSTHDAMIQHFSNLE